MVVPWIWVPIPKTRVNCLNVKKAFFSNFWCHSAKKFQVAANRTILILEGLPMAHLKAYVPNFSKLTRKRSYSLKLWVLARQVLRLTQKVRRENEPLKTAQLGLHSALLR